MHARASAKSLSTPSACAAMPCKPQHIGYDKDDEDVRLHECWELILQPSSSPNPTHLLTVDAEQRQQALSATITVLHASQKQHASETVWWMGQAAKQVSVCCYRPAAAPAESFQAAVGPDGLLGRHECCRRRHHSKLGLKTGPGDTPLRPAAAQQVMVVMACCCQGAHGLTQNACAQLLPRVFLPSLVHACAAHPPVFSCPSSFVLDDCRSSDEYPA
jgi:hypothetical protein